MLGGDALARTAGGADYIANLLITGPDVAHDLVLRSPTHIRPSEGEKNGFADGVAISGQERCSLRQHRAVAEDQAAKYPKAEHTLFARPLTYNRDYINSIVPEKYL